MGAKAEEEDGTEAVGKAAESSVEGEGKEVEVADDGERGGTRRDVL